jgi:hypothetical protein
LLATPFSRKSYAAFANTSFTARLAPRASEYLLTDDGANGDGPAGDGEYSRVLLRPSVPGHYLVHFRMRGRTPDGKLFQREESHSIFVDVGAIDPRRSGLHRERIAGRWYAVIQPRDRGGNFLGPGYTTLIVAQAKGGRLPIEDRLDGTYRIPLPDGYTPSDPVRIAVPGDAFFAGVLPELSWFEKLPWWLWLLLLLLIVVLVVWYRRTRP